MWSKFGNSSISMREVIITSIIQGFDRKTLFFEEWSWFKFNNFGLALGMTLKFYTTVSKGLKLKFRRSRGTKSYACRSYRGKTGMGFFCLSPSWIGLKCHKRYFLWKLHENNLEILHFPSGRSVETCKWKSLRSFFMLTAIEVN